MLVLGLESSCDETACAIVEASAGGARLVVRSDVIASQIALHARWGGIVPEVAARHHIESILPTLESALAEAGCQLADIDAVAVTRGPGLVGALLVAVQVGKTLAFARGLPLVGVNHLEGHLLAAFLEEAGAVKPRPPLPHLGLLVSGGHTSLVHVEDFGRYRVLGATCDDAAGEAFDKVGKLMGFDYPAGPIIDRLAATGDAKAVRFPKPMTGQRRGLQMSFSGLKTAAAAALSRNPPTTDAERADFCASFQAAIVEQLVRKTGLALDEYKLPAVVLSGGVACNRGLRAGLAALCAERGIGFFAAPPRFCTDNGAMIAGAGALRLLAGERAGLELNAVASLPL